MRLLAFDTSSKTGSIVALEWVDQSKNGFDSARLVSEWTLNIDTGFHSERLLWGIHQVLESARWKLEDLDVLGVGVGPGSFTGLRIGITTARTLAGILKKPLVGVSSLAALARPLVGLSCTTKKKIWAVAATDACKGELFALSGPVTALGGCVAMADQDFPGVWKRGVDEKVLAPEELIQSLAKKLKSSPGSLWIAVGEGRSRYTQYWDRLPKSREISTPFPFSDGIQGRYLGMLVWEGYQAGLAREALQVSPRYLRASDAELKLKAGLLPPGPSRGGTV